jgi:SAM-dependent methyltransferase
MDAARMPGHFLLARLGKRVLRPGGIAMTRQILKTLDIQASDRVIELAPGPGATARLALARRPASYIGVDRDGAAVAAVAALPHDGDTIVRGHRGDAGHTGLADGCATVVYGEAMMTMLPSPGKLRVIREAYRLLEPPGRYGMHELCLVPDDIDAALAEQIKKTIMGPAHVGARPLTVPAWRELLTEAGFTVVGEVVTPMRLLSFRRMAADEGLLSAVRIVVRALRDPVARRRVRAMRRAFHQYRDHLAGVSMVARRSSAAEARGA